MGTTRQTRKGNSPRPSLSYEVWAEVGATPTGRPCQQRVALCLHAEDAGAMVALYSYASPTIRMGRLVLWTEGKDGEAAESYDTVAQVCNSRLEDLHARVEQERREYLAQVAHAWAAAQRLIEQALDAGDPHAATRFTRMAEAYAAELAAGREG